MALLAVVALAAVITIVSLSSGKKAVASPVATPSAAKTSKNPCPQKLALRIVAASGIAPVIESVASKTCVNATVTVDDAASAAKLLKTGQADVWIPDSRVRGILAGTALSTSAPSLAASPLVMVANSTANTSKWTLATPLSWSTLLNQSALSPFTVQVESSATSSTTLVLASALNGLALTATGDKYLGLASVAEASATISNSNSDTVPATTLRIEEARLAEQQPDAKILPMAGGYPQLDYPWMAPVSKSAKVQSASAELLKALQGPLGDAARKKQGLLNPGSTSVAPGDYPGGASGALIPVPATSTISTLYAQADAGAQHGNILAVLDLSGSMDDLTGPGQQTKIAAVQSSAKIAAQLLSAQTRLGLWEFTYQLDPPNDYKQVVPMAPLSSNRTTLLNTLDTATPIPTGGTSLYRTTVAAYKYVQDNWKANYANSVLIFTDGRDESDPGAPTLAAVQAQLKTMADPKRPIQLIMLGYGNADIPAMTALTSTVGGVVYHITTATQIIGAFIDAISQSVLKSLDSA